MSGWLNLTMQRGRPKRTPRCSTTEHSSISSTCTLPLRLCCLCSLIWQSITLRLRKTSILPLKVWRMLLRITPQRWTCLQSEGQREKKLRGSSTWCRKTWHYGTSRLTNSETTTWAVMRRTRKNEKSCDITFEAQFYVELYEWLKHSTVELNLYPLCDLELIAQLWTTPCYWNCTYVDSRSGLLWVLFLAVGALAPISFLPHYCPRILY